MLNVMLVDDEPLALEGLKLLVDWAAEGFAVCAECQNANEALQQLTASRPDLIVTDIRMPGMDGLALMQAAKQQGFDGQFIVVSGYGDFDYAQRALGIGVAGYLLKPIEPAETSAILAHIRAKLIGRETRKRDQQTEYALSLSALLTAAGSTSEASLPGDTAGSVWRLATWGAPLHYNDVQNVLAAFPEGSVTAHIVEDKEYLALHWQAENAEPDWATAESLLRLCRRRLLKSETTSDPLRLGALRRQLCAQLDTTSGSLAERVEVLARAVALRQADECRARCADLEAFCDMCGAEAKSMARRQLLAECSRQFVNRPELLRQFLGAQTAGLTELCLHAIRLLTPAQERISDRVTEYIGTHADERITVESVAAALGYNATYLGRVFRDEQGTGFRERLSGVRVERAAELLCQTNACVCEIAEQVGYRQYKRFLRHFKQRYGITPEQYRRQNAPSKPCPPPKR